MLCYFIIFFANIVTHSKEMKMPSIVKLEKSISVSGISSGGYFAVQYHIAHSSTVMGAAIFAGGPYYCAESSLLIAETSCMNGAGLGPNVDVLVGLTVDGYAVGAVDDPHNLVDDRIFLFSGTEDTVVDQKVMVALENYYSVFALKSNIITDFNLTAEHCMPTLAYGEPCTTLASPYLGLCHFDGAADINETQLSHNHLHTLSLTALSNALILSHIISLTTHTFTNMFAYIHTYIHIQVRAKHFRCNQLLRLVPNMLISYLNSYPVCIRIYISR